MNVTESFSEVMEEIFSAIAESQCSLSLDGVPRLRSTNAKTWDEAAAMWINEHVP